MLAFTVSTANQLPKAACLARSLAETQPDLQTILCLVERSRCDLSTYEGYFTHVVLSSELGIEEFEPFLFQYSALEACMAVKAQILLWAMTRFPAEECFLYFDADIRAYSRFEELERILPNADVVVTPHHTEDEPSLQGVYDNVFRTLACGTFNSGFVGVRRTKVAVDFLEWWNKKLRRFCYKDLSSGLYFEQRWIDVAPSFFDLTIMREPGYNVANWNVSSRVVAKSSGHTQPVVNGKPLRFFHYSMVDSGRDMLYLKRYLTPESPVFGLRDAYVSEIRGLDSDAVSQRPWSYDWYLSGEPIASECRRIYRDAKHFSNLPSSPFMQSNSKLFVHDAQLKRPQTATATK